MLNSTPNTVKHTAGQWMEVLLAQDVAWGDGASLLWAVTVWFNSSGTSLQKIFCTALRTYVIGNMLLWMTPAPFQQQELLGGLPPSLLRTPGPQREEGGQKGHLGCGISYGKRRQKRLNLPTSSFWLFPPTAKLRSISVTCGDSDNHDFTLTWKGSKRNWDHTEISLHTH